MAKKGMKVFTPDNSELMNITGIKRDGQNIVVSGKIMGSMPMKAVMRPEEVRQALGLLDFKTILFIMTVPFRNLSAKTRDAK